MTEQTGKERRRAPRFNAELPCDLAPDDEELRFPGERLECRTRDLSETGVGVVAGSIYVGYACVVDEGRALLVRLALPTGEVSMEATAAHYLRLDSGGRGEPSYLIGLRINAMPEESLARYTSYLEELSRTEQD